MCSSIWQNHRAPKFWRSYWTCHRANNPYSFSLLDYEETHMHPFDFKFRVRKLSKLLNIVSPSRKFFPSGGIRNLHFQLLFPEDISEVNLWWECENPSHINGILIVEYKIGILIVKNDYPWFHFVTVSIHTLTLPPVRKYRAAVVWFSA